MELEELIDALAEQTREFVSRKLADLEAEFATTLTAVLDAKQAAGGEGATSLQRQLSRHSDHLASIESRMKKLERGE
jgi:hypothetical protein